ncbi:hypothetical protein CVT24_012960, partial [Panaeolus cyanescens]
MASELTINQQVGFRVRQTSPRFKQLPWLTDVTTTVDNFANLNFDYLKNLGRRINEREDKVFRVGNHTQFHLHSLLGVDITAVTGVNTPIQIVVNETNVTSFSSINLAQAQCLCNVLTPYRIIDMMVALENNQTLSNRSFETNKPVHGSVQNWLEDLVKFKQVYESAQPMSFNVNNHNTSHGTAPDEQNLPTNKLSPLESLMQQFLKSRHRQSYATIENNLLVCAMHIHYLLNDRSDGNVAIELPNTAEAFVASLLPQQDPLNPNAKLEYSQQLQTFYNELGKNMSRPLHAAIWSTWTCLLSGRSKLHSAINRKSLFENFQDVWSSKSPLMVACEDVIMLCVRAGAIGGLEYPTIVDEVYHKLPWAAVLQAKALQHVPRVSIASESASQIPSMSQQMPHKNLNATDKHPFFAPVQEPMNVDKSPAPQNQIPASDRMDVGHVFSPQVESESGTADRDEEMQDSIDTNKDHENDAEDNEGNNGVNRNETRNAKRKNIDDSEDHASGNESENRAAGDESEDRAAGDESEDRAAGKNDEESRNDHSKGGDKGDKNGDGGKG